MGSIAQDKNGNMALGYSVSNGTTVFPGIRYTGRLKGDTLGTDDARRGRPHLGTGVQTTTNSRWGDYTSMNVDPTDDCTFWYVNEYYTLAGQATSTAGWQTRIGSVPPSGLHLALGGDRDSRPAGAGNTSCRRISAPAIRGRRPCRARHPASSKGSRLAVSAPIRMLRRRRRAASRMSALAVGYE